MTDMVSGPHSAASLVEMAIADPAGTYRALRDRGPVHWDADSASWYVLSAELVVPLLRDGRLRSRGVPAGVRDLNPADRAVIGPVEEFFARWLAFSDPPKQTAIRRAVGPLMTRRAQSDLLNELPRRAEEVLSAIDGRDAELLKDVARPLSRYTTQWLLGVGVDEIAVIEDLSDALIHYLATPGMDRVAAVAAGEAIGELGGLVDGLASGGGGFALALARLRSDEPDIGRLDVAAVYAQLLTGALEPLTTALAACLIAAGQHPDRPEGPDEVSRFVEEVLRDEPPFHFAPRVAREDILIGNSRIRAGDRVVVNLLAANHDRCPRSGTGPPDHFSFGAGTHYCLGAAMSRAHLATILPVLLRGGVPERIDHGRIVRRSMFGMTGFATVPLVASGAARRSPPDPSPGVT